MTLWSALRLLPKFEQYKDFKDTIQFILDYPRRVYTHLFPSAQTWWLFTVLVTLNAVDWVGFELINLNNPAVTMIPRGPRVLDGLFQAFAIRSSGFTVVSISSLQVAVQMLYVAMMFASIYPVTITIRSSDVYEERSLGIYADNLHKSLDIANTIHKSKLYFIREQLQRQLVSNFWFVIGSLILIVLAEAANLYNDSIKFSTFNIISEVFSAYGCVGLSIGLPNQAYSFCGDWHVVSKLILCTSMLRGRHRELPVPIDCAIHLSSDRPGVMEEEDQLIQITSARVRTSTELV